VGNNRATSVVKLMPLLAQHSPSAPERPVQVVYSDPGDGTNYEFPADGIASKMAGFFCQLKGLALGSGAFNNIARAYEFLCSTREERPYLLVWLSAWGVYGARSGGMVNMYGLVHAPGLPLIRSLLRAYFAQPADDRTAFTRDKNDRQFVAGRTPLFTSWAFGTPWRRLAAG
jgi:uncharacterized protein (DUF2235 family)